MGDQVVQMSWCLERTGDQVVWTSWCLDQTGDQVIRTDANFFKQFTNGCKRNPAQKQKVIRVCFPVHVHKYLIETVQTTIMSGWNKRQISNWSSAGYLKRVQFYNWFRLHQKKSSSPFSYAHLNYLYLIYINWRCVRKIKKAGFISFLRQKYIYLVFQLWSGG